MAITYGSNKIQDTRTPGIYYGGQAINAIYCGSKLVYKWHPVALGTVFMNVTGAGDKVVMLPAGKYQITVAGYCGNGSQMVSWGTYYAGSGGSGAAVYGTFTLSKATEVVLHSGANGGDPSTVKIGGKEAIKCTGGGTASFDFFMNMSGNGGGVASVDNSLFATTELIGKNGNVGSGKTTAGGVAGGASVSDRNNWGAGGATMAEAGTPGGIFLQFIGE